MGREKKAHKIIKFDRAVSRMTVRAEDGSEEVIRGAYTIELSSGMRETWFETSRATATEYRRIKEEGFTEAEAGKILDNEPFSADPSVDCRRVISRITWDDEIAVHKIRSELENLREICSSREDGADDDPDGRIVISTHLIRSYAGFFRLPKNLELAEELKRLRPSKITAEEIELLLSYMERRDPGNVRVFLD